MSLFQQPLHTLVFLFFNGLILCLFVRMILSWLPLPPGNPFTRFFVRLTAPVLDPVARRIPSMAVGMFDLGMTIAFIFTWWMLGLLSALILSALPPTW